MNKDKVNIFWFRRDLRFFDNHGFFKALKSDLPVLPIFIFDKNILTKLPSEQDTRIDFIHHSLTLLQQEFIKAGSCLTVIFDEPLHGFDRILKEYDVQAVYTNHDYEPYAIQRDQAVGTWFTTRKIQFFTFKDQVIFERSEVMKADGTPYTIFTPYSKIWKQRLELNPITTYPSEKLLARLYQTKIKPWPTAKALGFEIKTSKVAPPALEPGTIKSYHLTRNLPAVRGTSNLSVHLRFGTVSIRSLCRKALTLNEQWLNELIWREFFMMILFHFPYVIHQSFKSKYDAIIWRNNESEFDAWCKGETGYPIVDAGMHELNQTGLMHNRVRMIVASFLTKHLLIDWRWGEAYFADKLLDFELSSNNGNWQWAAGCGCDAAPYFRIFNPSEQTRKFDPDHVYIKKWLSDDQIYFLNPLVDHVFARKRALEVYKHALTPTL
ncbi:MAG: deoxyribodipyrimidine photo-lyase [Saprospiraceae bacterium]